MSRRLVERDLVVVAKVLRAEEGIRRHAGIEVERLLDRRAVNRPGERLPDLLLVEGRRREIETQRGLMDVDGLTISWKFGSALQRGDIFGRRRRTSPG